ncbi:hypothetical protein [Kitasatospora phosalacinea]
MLTRITAPTANTPRAPRLLAYLFTVGSAAWTLYSVWDLLGTGLISITTGAGAEGLWVGGMLAYRAKPTWLTAAAMFAGLAGTIAILATHGFSAYHWGGIVAVVPPLAAELFWHVDAQLSADPTDLTPEQQDEVNDVLREARHVTARAAAEQALEDAEHAAKLARIRRDGELRQAEDVADFDVAVSRIDMQRQIARRTPLMLTAPPNNGPDWDGPDRPGGLPNPTMPNTPNTARPNGEHQANTPSEHENTSSAAVLHLPANISGESVSATVRRAYSLFGRDPQRVLAFVREHHGDNVNPDSVAATLRRVAGPNRATG